jgi:hypothetical protein
LLFVVIGLLLLLFKEQLFNFEELSLKSKYEELKDKPVLEMSKEEWDTRNQYEVFDAKKNNKKIDTISFEQAKQYALLDQFLTAQNSPCNETKMIETFHEMMKFNMPYDKYNKERIETLQLDECTLRISVTTTDAKEGWKTFWIFELTFNKEDRKYNMNVVKKDFLG